ncbi:MAG: hypothetical protein QOE63_80, partial [Acidimicrobiaceae bacterium]
MGRHDLHRAVERLARQQHGVITREQALSLGFTPRMVEGLLRSQAWTTLGPSIYALAPFPPTWQREYKAAELSVREAGLGGLAAARVLDFEGFGVARPEVVTETYTVNARSELAIVHRARDVRFTTARGFRVTTPAQTLADLVTR